MILIQIFGDLVASIEVTNSAPLRERLTKFMISISESSCLFYLSLNSDFYVSKIMHL